MFFNSVSSPAGPLTRWPVFYKSAGRRFGPAAIIILLGALVYANSFRGQYFLDDFRGITDKQAAESIGSIFPLSKIYNSQLYWTRPVLGFTLALNYAISGTDKWSYHLVNLLIHLLAGLTLFGILRRTLAGGKFTSAAALWLALLCSLLWLLHPLQTQSVTYIIQRSEALMGLCYLLTLYCLIRGAARGNWLWLAAGVCACALGMGSKEVMFTAPFAAWLYDRTFLAGSFGGALRRRGLFYLGLALSMSFPVYRVYTATTLFGAGGESQITPLDYAKTQCGVILHYLWLAICPLNLCFDYWWPVAHSLLEVLPGFLVIFALLAATVWAVVKKPAWGFVGASFFLILSVTSSVVPIMDVAFEQRMYLPLAPVVVALVLGAYSLLDYVLRRPGITWRAAARYKLFACEAAVLAVMALALLTVRRNLDYQDDVVMWTDVTAKAPQNVRAFNNLGLGYLNRHKYPEAEKALRESVRLCPGYWRAQYNLGLALEGSHRYEEALAAFLETRKYETEPKLLTQIAICYNFLGSAQYNNGALAEAEAQFRKAVECDPAFWTSQYNLGQVLEKREEYELAVRAFRESLKLNPKFTEACNHLAFAAVNWGIALAAQGRWDAASASFTEALQGCPGYLPASNALLEARTHTQPLDEQQKVFVKALKLPLEIWGRNPADPTAREDIAYWDNGLGLFLLGREKFAEAAAAFEQVLKAKPDYWQAHFNLGLVLARSGSTVEAGRQFSETLRLNPGYIPARDQLTGVVGTLNNDRGVPLLPQSKFAEAEAVFREVIELDPAYLQGWHNLGVALQHQGKLEEAINAYQTVLRLNPDYTPSKDFLAQCIAQLIKEQKKK